MSTQENTPQTMHVPEQGGLSARKQAQIDELLVQMHATTNPDELVALAERLKLLAQQPADELHTFDESELPEWSIHEEDQENLNAFFNEPADRGGADAAFTIPRGASDPTEIISGATNKEFTLDAEPAPEPKPDSAAKHEVAEHNIETHKNNGEVDKIESKEVASMTEEESQDHEAREVSRREDFARFHCIYESKDGQLALYEDEQGHLTAVNANRFA